MNIVLVALLLADAGEPVVPLSPEAAVAVALERSGAVAAAQRSAERNALNHQLALDPLSLKLGHRSVDGLVTTPHTDGNGNPYTGLDDTYVALQWKLPDPVSISHQWENDDAAFADQAQITDAKNDLAADVRSLHAEVLALRAERALADDTLAIMGKLEHQTEQRLGAEAATALDARLATLRRIDSAADVEDVRANAERSEHRLAALLGRPSPLALVPSALPLCTPPTGSLDAIIAHAKERAPGLKVIAAQRERAKLEASLAFAAYLPFIDSVTVGWYNNPLDKRDALHAGIEIALPIFEPLTGRSRSASIEEQRLEAIYTDASRGLEADVRSAYDKLMGALALVQLYENSRKDVEEALADVQRSLDAGQADIFRVVEVEARAVNAQRGLLHARSRCEGAAIDLMHISGDAVPAP